MKNEGAPEKSPDFLGLKDITAELTELCRYLLRDKSELCTPKTLLGIRPCEF